MRFIITTECGTRIDIDAKTRKFSAVDINGIQVEQGTITTDPQIIPGLPLVLGTSTGSVKFLGMVKGVVYR